MDVATNASLSTISTNSTFYRLIIVCLLNNAHVSFSAFIAIRVVLIFPFSVWVLYIGYQRWQQQRSFAGMNPSDLITYHMALMQLIGAPAVAIHFYGVYDIFMYYVSLCILSVSIVGELMFHLFTCIERYLAIVHPIAYLGLKTAKGIRIRKISVWSIWFFFFGWCPVTILCAPDVSIHSIICLLSFCFVAVSFCSLSALCALIRPGPGEGVADRERADQSKRKAFHTIVVITAVLWLFFVGYILCMLLSRSPLLDSRGKCLTLTSGLWFSLPSSLVVTLLFLHRSGKLSCGCQGTA